MIPTAEIIRAQAPMLHDGSKGVESSRWLWQGLPEELNLTLEGAVLVYTIHLTQAENADIVQANTFGANADNMAAHGLTDVYKANYNGVKIAQAAVDGTGIWVAGSIGPTPGGFKEYGGKLAYDELVEAHLEQVRAQRDADVDVFNVETFMTELEMRAVLEAVAQEAPQVPVFATMSFKSFTGNAGEIKFHKTSIDGTSPRKLLEIVREYPQVIAVGVNCGEGIVTAEKLVGEFIANQEPTGCLPLVAKLNAGQEPNIATPAQMAAYAERMHKMGVAVIGGCCGTDWKHLARMAEALGKQPKGTHFLDKNQDIDARARDNQKRIEKLLGSLIF